MKEDEIRGALERVFREVFENDTFVFSDALSPERLESWDSLGHIRLITATEESFDVRFTIEQIDQLTSVGRIVECLSRHS